MRPLKQWERDLEGKIESQKEELRRLTDENVKTEKPFKTQNSDKGQQAAIRGPYFEHAKKLAESQRNSLDKSLQLEEKRKEITSLQRLLEERNKDLETIQISQGFEKQEIDGLKGQKAGEEQKLQQLTTEFEERQISFLTDLVSLEDRINTQANHP